MSTFELSRAAADPAVWVIQANDRINLGNTDELIALARQAFDQGGRRLLLDLSRTPSVTSAGLRAIISIFKLFGGKAGFKLVSPSADVRRVLEIAGMADGLDIHAQLHEAVASF